MRLRSCIQLPTGYHLRPKNSSTLLRAWILAAETMRPVMQDLPLTAKERHRETKNQIRSSGPYLPISNMKNHVVVVLTFKSLKRVTIMP